jgi:dTDP-L-rhamnose 4-epimerase
MQLRILITGGAGFIGSHLAQKLIEEGHKVRVLDNFSEQVHGENQELPSFIKDDVELIRGDVRSPDDVNRALEGIDVVYHFAASVGVGQSMYEIHSYVDNNNLGTANLLQNLIRYPIKKLVIASSMSIYGEGSYKGKNNISRNFEMLKKKKWEPMDKKGKKLKPMPTSETKTPDLSSIYALSKYDQERMCLLIGKAYSIPTVALRFFNVYGPGQALSNPYTGVLAIFASRLLNNNPPLIFEDGRQLRDFVHVSDVVQACKLALEVPEAEGQAFNIGSGQHYTVKEIATLIANAMGKHHIKSEITGNYRVGDIRHCFSDISRAKKILGYQPKVKLKEGITDLVTWLSSQRATDKSKQMREELSSRGLTL